MEVHSAKAVAKFLLERAQEKGLQLTPMQVLKLVYIAHGWMLGLYNRPLIKEDVEAWEYGPVIPNLYRSIKHYRNLPVQAVKSAHEEDFDDYEMDVIDQVLDIYGRKTGIHLSSITHAPGTPWADTWYLRGRNSVISNDLIADHYATLYEKSHE